MANDAKTITTNPASKDEVASKDKSGSGVETPNAEGGKFGDASPSGYSRGEGQKPVSKAYRDNWNAIFAKKRNDNSADFLARISDYFFPPKPTEACVAEHRDNTGFLERVGASTVA